MQNLFQLQMLPGAGRGVPEAAKHMKWAVKELLESGNIEGF